MHTVDFLVVGGGMAGASVAYELANEGRVVVLEQEAQPGYHATGRSAAQFSEIYGNALVRALSRGSRRFLFEPPQAFSDTPFVHPRGILFIASSEQLEALSEFRRMPDVARGTRLLTTSEVMERVPILRSECVASAAYEPDAMDLEVHSLHQAYIRGFRARGASIVCNCAIRSIARVSGRWVVETSAGTFSAAVLINAAGAWADNVARAAAAAPIGLVPKLRTVLLVDPPAGLRIDAWPVIVDITESYYFKPDAGRILLSPADETPSEPCDAHPDELDVAIAVDRFEQATTLVVDRVTHRWAGLRTFVADRAPVVGFDPSVDGFFWVVAQGGYGIQMAPAVARAAAALACGRDVPADLQEQGVSAAALSPARLNAIRPAAKV